MSPKFKQLATNALKNKGPTEKSITVTIDNIKPEIMNIILKFGSGVDTNIPQSCLIPLRKAASYFQLQDLVSQLDSVLLESMTVNNFCQVYGSYCELKNFKLMNCCLEKLKKIKADHTKILASPHFLSLKLETGLKMLMQSHNLNVPLDFKLRKCADWARNQDFTNPKSVLKKLSICIYFSCTEGPILEHVLYPIPEEALAPAF
jgi:hypothetical protein